MTIAYGWRAGFGSDALDALHAAGFDRPPEGIDWLARVERHSLGWVCARLRERLVGFVNVAWDGGAHAFILDTVVAPDVRGRGVGTGLVRVATDGARAAGCRWLHVDYEAGLAGFYQKACGFTPTAAGLVAL
ncbi:GNAT family N-acetyltransferase [Actinoplanes sp. NPDC049118]|uniref:GNAT family N-acetyltransferase n=1 Tax=Actinoplanes sp. NPDC049118 TaxID=3155769 RepID=UPI0033F7C00B